MSTRQRRLSARRGSTSASDPFGTHLHLSRSVQSSSTLTIVRVTTPPVTPPVPAPEPSSPRRYQRRLPSNPAQQQPSSPGSSPDAARLSFAFSSFGPRASSPHRAPSPHRLSQSGLPNPKPRLTPDQLLDAARSATHPRPVSHSSPSQSPLVRPHSPHVTPSTTGPATFTPLPDDIHLPFIDRPSEVAALISSPPSAKLFTLLAQTFKNDENDDLATDPTKWSYPQLLHHLTTVPRSQSPDTLWVLLARKCILAHSELIWERIKGALGVPPELDIDYDLLDHEPDLSSARSVSSIDTDDISDDQGRAPRGHWDDWDAVMDSPVFDRRPQDPASPVLPISLSAQRREDDIPDDRLADSIISPTPVSPSSLLSIEPILFPSPNSTIPPPPPLSLTTSDVIGVGLGDIEEGAEDEEQDEDAQTPPDATPEKHEDHDPDLISPSQIQGLRISTTPRIESPVNSRPVSLTFTSSRPVSQTFTSSRPVSQNLTAENSLGSIPPPSTSTSASSIYVAPSPISPLPPYPSTTAASGGVASRSGSFSSVGPFRRSASWGSLAAAAAAAEDQRDDEPGYEYDPVGDRSPGNPLFPSNFARLAPGPTLVANNPALRSPGMPPLSRYVGHLGVHKGVYPGATAGQKMRTYSHGAVGGGSSGGMAAAAKGYRRQSWGVSGGGGGGGTGSEYAVSVASGSSVGHPGE